MIHLHTRGASQVVLGVNAGDIRDVGSVPRLGRSPGEGSGNPLQYSSLENPMDRGVWQAAVHGVSKSQTQLSMPVQLSPPMKEVKLTHPPA